jgi:clan AA aspartic protease (TIGR02281 family)
MPNLASQYVNFAAILKTQIGIVLVLLLVLVTPAAVQAADFDFKIAMSQADSGNFYVKGRFGNEQSTEFLVDTGSGLVILSEPAFKRIVVMAGSKPVSRKAARMADGRTKAINVYSVEQLVLGQNCRIGPIEVAVIPGATRNILGLSALNKVAPFAIYTSPPTLALSGCLGDVLAIAKSEMHLTTAD